MEDELKLAAKKSSSEIQYEIRKLIVRMLKKEARARKLQISLA